MPAAAKTSFAFFYFLVLLFVWFGSTRARDCWLKDKTQSWLSKCKKQCCGSDGNALSCLDTCNGISCTSHKDCDEGCCKWSVYSLDYVCHDCPTQPPRTPTTPWNKTTTEQPTLIWTTRSTTEEPSPVKLALSNGQIRLVIGFGCAAVVVGVIVYYAFRYSKGRRSRRRRRAVVVVEREPEINIMMIRQTRTISTPAQPAAATVHSTAANYGFRPEYGHPRAVMPIQYAPPPYQP